METERDLVEIFGKPSDNGGAALARDVASAPSYTFFTIPELSALPRQGWLIDKAIPSCGLVGLIGPKGCYKTFAALDIALHVAFGLQWHGRLTQRAAVAYIMAEGAFGTLDRVNAWLAFYERAGLDVDRDQIPLQFLTSRVPMNSASAITRLERDIRAQFPPGDLPELLVVDTLNRNLDGDEDGKGMTGFAAGCTTLQQAFGATVLSVHHTPLGTEERGRGHSAWDGAIDTRLVLSRDDDRVTLECSHQRNGPDGWSVAFEATPLAGSLVLKPSSPTGGELKGQRRQLLELVSSMDTAPTYTTWLRESGLKAPSFKKARAWLVARDYVKVDGTKYRVTDVGRSALGIPRIPEGYHA